MGDDREEERYESQAQGQVAETLRAG